LCLSLYARHARRVDRPIIDEPGAIDATAHFMDKLEEIGFCDLWRRRNPDGREFSWYSTRGNGFRIDHAFLSPALAVRAGSIHYSHAERLAGLSDHSPSVLESWRKDTAACAATVLLSLVRSRTIQSA
jgi:exonuclease III